MRAAAIAVAITLTVSTAAAQAPSVASDTTGSKLNACAPATYDQAIDCLDRNLPAEAKAKLATKDGTVMAHFGLGQWMRNNWGLWKGGPLAQDMRKRGATIPDDMSAAILQAFVARMKSTATR